MIALKDFAADCGIEIMRDAAVETLGLLVDRREAVLAPFYDRRYLAQLERNKRITMVLTTGALAPAVPADRGIAVSADPLDSFYALHCRLFETKHYWKSTANEIAVEARIHPTACIAERDVRIGAGCVIGPNAVIEERTVIGAHCTIGAGTVIGSEGFEVRRLNGRQIAIPHAGGVRIGPNVTIQANVVVDRALFGGFTEIGEDTVIDNLVHVAHEVSIGRRCRIVACTFIGGSTVLGDDIWVGPNATISSSLRLGDGARITMGAVVTRDVAPGGHVSGNFAIDHERLVAHIKRIR